MILPRYSIGTQNANSSFDVQIGGSLLKKWCFLRIGKGKTIELDEFILRQRSRIWEADRQRCSIVECDGRIFDFLHLIQHLLLAGLAKKSLNSAWKLAVYFGHGSFRTERKGLFSDLSLSLSRAVSKFLMKFLGLLSNNLRTLIVFVDELQDVRNLFLLRIVGSLLRQASLFHRVDVRLVITLRARPKWKCQNANPVRRETPPRPYQLVL